MSVAITIDTSGSCEEFWHSRKALDRLKVDFGGQQVRLITFNDRVNYDNTVDVNDFDYSGVRFRHGGGTRIDGVVKLLREDPVDHLVMLTDGYFVSRDMSRCAGAITFLLYNELPEHERDLLLKDLNHKNVFMEILEKAADKQTRWSISELMGLPPGSLKRKGRWGSG